MKDDFYQLRGHFHLDIIDKATNEIVDSVDDHNMIMTPARKSMSEIFANLFGVKHANKFGLGTMGCQDSSKFLPRDEFTGFEKSRDRMFCEPSTPYNVGDVIPILLYGDLIAIKATGPIKQQSTNPITGEESEPNKKTIGSWMTKDGTQGSFTVDETGEGTWSSNNGASGLVTFVQTQGPDETPDEPDTEIKPGDVTYYQYLGGREVEYQITDDQLANSARFRVVTDLPYVYYTHFELPRYNTEGPSTEWNLDKKSMDAIGVQQKDTSVIFTFIIDQESGNNQHDNDPDFINPTSEFNEAAIYVNDRIFCMKTFPTKVKDNSVKFKIVWTITF